MSDRKCDRKRAERAAGRLRREPETDGAPRVVSIGPRGGGRGLALVLFWAALGTGEER